MSDLGTPTTIISSVILPRASEEEDVSDVRLNNLRFPEGRKAMRKDISPPPFISVSFLRGWCWHFKQREGECEDLEPGRLLQSRMGLWGVRERNLYFTGVETGQG